MDGEELNSFTQKNIKDGVVMYHHTAGEIGSDPDEDSFSLTLSDLSDEWTIGGNRVDQVNLRVNILPVDSEAPVVTVGDVLLVEEGQKAMVEPVHLDARDDDTNTEEILCVITTQASEGFVENISPAPGSEKSRTGIPVSSFTIGDVKNGYIFYVQNVHEGSEPTEDRFAFVCQDGAPNFSDPTFLNIGITSGEQFYLFHILLAR